MNDSIPILKQWLQQEFIHKSCVKTPDMSNSGLWDHCSMCIVLQYSDYRFLFCGMGSDGIRTCCINLLVVIILTNKNILQWIWNMFLTARRLKVKIWTDWTSSIQQKCMLLTQKWNCTFYFLNVYVSYVFSLPIVNFNHKNLSRVILESFTVPKFLTKLSLYIS